MKPAQLDGYDMCAEMIVKADERIAKLDPSVVGDTKVRGRTRCVGLVLLLCVGPSHLLLSF